MVTSKLPDRNGDFEQTAAELTDARRAIKFAMMDAFDNGHGMYNSGDYRGAMAAANEGAYFSWLACEVSAMVQFLMLLSPCCTRMAMHTDAIRYAQAAVHATGAEGLRLRDHGIESFRPVPPPDDLDPDQLDLLVHLALQDGVGADAIRTQVELQTALAVVGCDTEVNAMFFADVRIPGMATPQSSYPARLTAHCASAACVALGNAYSAALQQDKAVAAHRAGLRAIEHMPETETWDSSRWILHKNIGNQCKHPIDNPRHLHRYPAPRQPPCGAHRFSGV